MKIATYMTTLVLAMCLATGCASTSKCSKKDGSCPKKTCASKSDCPKKAKACESDCAKACCKKVEFATQTVSLGIVVSDMDASLKFYKCALGLKEVRSFDVPAVMGKESGLSDNLPFSVVGLKLGDDATATEVKLMQFKQAPGKTIDNAFIHSSYGVRYLTIFVKDMDAVVTRCKAAGVEPIANGPYLLPEGFPEGLYLTCVRDPDGNMIELVGPKK